MKYYVSTVERYNHGEKAGQLVPDSAWSADVMSYAESKTKAIYQETIDMEKCFAYNPDCLEVIEIDTDYGYIIWNSEDYGEVITEVYIKVCE